jgi:hypothetical protein
MLRGGGGSSKSMLPSSYDWLRGQTFNAENYRLGTSPTRPGTLAGGFNLSQLTHLASWKDEIVAPDPPKLTQSILNGKTGSAQMKIGQLQLEEIDPFATLTQLTGSFVGLEQPVIGEGGSWLDPQAFLDAKGIDMVNAPSRLADYAWNTTFGLPAIIGAQLANQPMPVVNLKDQQYPFQQTPTYWPFVAVSNDQQLRQLAVDVTSKYADPDTNQYLVDRLFEQFKIDRNKMTYLSSGNARTDFIAKKRLENYLDLGLLPKEVDNGASMQASLTRTGPWNPAVMQLGQHDIGASQFAAFVPVIGTQIDELLNKIKPETEQAWASYTPAQRKALFDSTGLYSMGSEMVGAMLVLAPAGALAAGAKGTATLGGNALKAYDTLLNLSKASMAVGVTGATTTWAAASFFPDSEFVQGITKRIDQSRPVSESYFAGAVNALGMFSSGTYGINTAVRMNSRVLSGIAGAARLDKGIATITKGVMGGMPDLRFHAFGFGGSEMADFMVNRIGLPAQELKVGIQRVFMSETLNTLRDRWRAGWIAELDGVEGGVLQGMTTEQKLEVQAMQAARLTETSTVEAEHVIRTMGKAREDQPLGLFIGGDDAIREANIARRNARSWDDGMTRRFINQYASPFMARLAGADTPEALRKWLSEKITKLGYDGTALPSAKSWTAEKWRQATRMVYHFDFNRWADTIAAAAGGSEEAARISIMSMRHLFKDEADRALAVLRGDDEAAALAMMNQLMDKIEVEKWHGTEVRSSVRKGPGAPVWEATPAKMADHIEDIYEALSTRRRLPPAGSPEALDALNYVHGEMEKEGLWTIGFKPVNEAGDFVVHIQTRTGHVVESPWLDYPLSNVPNIEIGNRGLLSSKLDGVTRGFRTWRLLEYQKGSLFRSLTDKTDLTPTQIEAFHTGVMDLARKHNVSPQAVGRMPRVAPGLRSVSQEVNDLADRVFGGEVRGKDGKVINWHKEVGDAYRQAYRLNLTAGLTSHLKSRFGPIGEAVTYGSDFIYVMWRFGLSPLFKAGEIWESAQLNLMRRVYPGDDPYTSSLYVRYGAGSDPAIVATERTLDPMIAGMDSTIEVAGVRNAIAPARERVLNQTSNAAEEAQRRAASSLGFYARSLPEDHAQVIARTAMREQAKRYRAIALGGEAIRTTDRGRLMAELANSVDENGMLVRGADYGRLRTVLRQLNREDLDPQVAAALDAHPWGAPTNDQIREAANMRAQAEVLRDPVQYQKADGTLDEDAILQTWRDLIADGHMAPDAALTLRDRYDEMLATLRTERENSRKVAAGEPVDPDWVWPDLTDPVTGQQVLRSVLNASDREFSTAIRSISQRRRYVKVTPPTAEEMAHRLDIAAEARLSPTPILRSDRVGPPDAIPADFTTDPAQVYVAGQTNFASTSATGPQFDADGNLILSTASNNEGVLEWLDLENTMPEDRAMWHTTTNIDAVHDTGLYSRRELMERGTPPEAVAALKAAADAGTPHSEISIKLRDGSSIGMNPPIYEALVAGRRKLIKDSWTGDEVPWEDVATITNRTSGDVLWTNAGAAPAPRGLGAHGVDALISTTTDRLHADTIAERLTFLSEVARDEQDGVDIIRHFYNGYDELTGGDISSIYEMAAALNLHAYVNATEDWLAEEQLARAIDRAARSAPDPAQYLFDATLTLDKHLHRAMKDEMAMGSREEGFTHGVILIISKEQAARIRPEQVGVVQVAVRQSKPVLIDSAEMDTTVREAVWARVGPSGDLHDTAQVITIFNPHGGRTELDIGPEAGVATPLTRAQFDKMWDDASLGYLSQVGGASGVQISHSIPGAQPGDAWQYTTVAGSERAIGEVPRVGPDQFELQAHSNDVFVIDHRVEAEPLATDAEGLLRQLRQVIDEKGDTIPGYQKRHDQIVHDLDQMRSESLNPDPVTSLDQIPEEPAGMTANLLDRMRSRLQEAKGKASEMGDEFLDPVPGKEAKQDRLIAQMQREEFPRVMAGTGLEKVFRELGIPEQKRADFLVQDRALLERWTTTRDPGDFQRLVEHAGGPEDRAALDALYNSEEWQVISGLWGLNLQGASEEAFGVHFFDQYRSPLLRGMNHPVLGVYPAAWAVKTAREWAKFLFDNRMFGVDLRLGMSPAVAIAQVARAQQVAFAQSNPEYDGTLEDYMREGPLGSTIFVFNLLMPGDWSALPFPLSRSLREVLRTWPNVNPGDILQKNIDYMGVTRDIRLMGEMTAEAKDFLFPATPEPNVPRPRSWTSTPKRAVPKWYDVPTR